MTNASFGYVNAVDGAATVLTASSPISTLPVSNLQNPIIVRPFRSGAVSASVTFDFGSNQSVDFLALAQGWNATMMAASDTVRHRLDPDGGTPGAGASLDTGNIACNIAAGYGAHAYFIGTTKSVRYWRLDFNAASLAALGYVDFGRAWAGPLITASVNPVYGYAEQWQDSSVVTIAPRSGAEYIDVLPKRRNIVLEFDALNVTEGMVTFKELSRICGLAQQLFYAFDPAGTYVATEMMFCRRAADDAISRPRLNLFDQQIHLRQSL